jgi:hypothetical protein
MEVKVFAVSGGMATSQLESEINQFLDSLKQRGRGAPQVKYTNLATTTMAGGPYVVTTIWYE